MKTLKYLTLILAIAVFLLLRIVDLQAKTDHKEFKNIQMSECFDCHKNSNVQPNHDSGFIKEHRILAEKSGSNCIECHEQSFCLDCHIGGGIDQDLKKSISTKGNYMPKTHRSDFISIHPVKAMDNPQNCYRCHEANFCESCHEKLPSKGTMKIKSHTPLGANNQTYWNDEHTKEVRRNLQSCSSCHPSADVCVQCHSAKDSGVNPHPKNWRSIKDSIRDKGNPDKTCKKCHLQY